MTKSQADQLARTYRTMAGRMLDHMMNGKAREAGCYDQIKAAHDAACRAFMAIENKHGL